MFFILAAAEGGHEENGFWLPHDINEVLWGSLAFFIIAALLWLKALPAAKSMAQGRTERIAKELADAEAARSEAEGELAELQSRIANAESERQKIVAEAQQQATALQAQLAERAAADAEAIRARGTADAESAKTQAIADLQAEVASLALGAAEAVVTQSMDAPTQQSLIDSYIDQVGGR